MPELVRSVVSRVRVFFKDRRQSPRLRVRLVFNVGIKREVTATAQTVARRLCKGTRGTSARKVWRCWFRKFIWMDIIWRRKVVS